LRGATPWKIRAVSDLRDATAVQLSDSEKHFKVEGKAKVDGDKHHWSCEVKNRHVTRAEYDGPKPEGMSTAAKLAVGAAAAVAAGVAISEAELESRGYTYAKGETGGGSSYANWRKGSHCVTVRTVDGQYESIVDVTMLDCQ
jgi:hypothetical protein